MPRHHLMTLCLALAFLYGSLTAGLGWSYGYRMGRQA